MKSQFEYDSMVELYLFIENTWCIYNKVTCPVIDTLAKKRIKGIYNHEKALKSWEYVAAAGAKQYIKEFCAKDDKWYEIFSKTTRTEAAKEIQKYYEQLIREAVNKKEGK